MLAGRARWTSSSRCRFYTTSSGPKPIPVLPDSELDTFRRDAFDPATPALLPRQSFTHLPAVRKWFSHAAAEPDRRSLNHAYLSRFGSTVVPLEITNDGRFARIEHSLSFFLECANASSSCFQTAPQRYFSGYVPGARAVRRTRRANDFFSSAAALAPPTARVYLAQAPLADLPRGLRNDAPTPELVLRAGRGDVYDSSVWLGQAPTYTPLHRDPNPNLFVQLAGTKRVRLLRPDEGRAVFAKVQESIGGGASATMRGEEMMQGAEKEALEEEVWRKDSEGGASAWEAELRAGDALFIPKGWWHSVKGIGEGMTGSVNWWFR